MDKFNHNRAQWDSNLDYLLVTIGSVIGLGNIFQFSHFVAKYGAYFIIFYLFFELLISVPIILSEFFIGRRGKQNPVGAISLLAMESGASHRWRWAGWICFIILVLSLGYYSLNVSNYLGSFVAELSSIGKAHPSIQQIQPMSLTAIFGCFLVFLMMTMSVVARGINRGLEKISRVVVPLFFILFLALAIYSSVVGSFRNALEHLLNFNAQLSYPLIFSALIYAFFKLNVAMGSMIVYGSYLPSTTRIGRSTLMIVIFDLVASLLSYFIIFPLLTKQVNPLIFSNLNLSTILHSFLVVRGGLWVAALFLLGAVFASWMPAIAFAESATVTIIERGNLKRMTSAIIVAICAMMIGACILFTSQWTLMQLSLEEAIQELAAQILTPISALLMALFAGWVIHQDIAQSELGFGKGLFALWQFLMRYIIPVCIVIVFIYLFWV